jgi:uncharacterized UBP type Zn finger protein
MANAESTCSHLETAARRDHAVKPSAHGCSDCLAMGGTWVHLRLCLTCGHVGCCDNSPNRHATKHYHASGHPVIRSYEPSEPWAYCYVDEAFVEELPALDGEDAERHYVAHGR